MLDFCKLSKSIIINGMNEKNFINLPEVGDHGQRNLQFDDSPEPKAEANTVDIKTLEREAYEKEKAKVADMYKIFNTAGLEKKEDGNWYFLNMRIEEYDELMNSNDNTDQYKIARKNAEEIKKINSDLKRFAKNGGKPYKGDK